MRFNLKLKTAFLVFLIISGAACGIVSRLDSGAMLISKTADNLAIKGYDAVAYRTIETAAQGKPEYEFAWNGAKWLFISRENRDRFAASPEAYAPEYGGYCAWSISESSVMEADPEAWNIVDGKLYLIQNGSVKEVWEKSQPEAIKKGDENWRQMKNK